MGSSRRGYVLAIVFALSVAILGCAETPTQPLAMATLSLPATVTPAPTATPLPPTFTPTSTSTPAPPTVTPSPTWTPVPPTATGPTMTPRPTRTPRPTPVLATSAQQIIGTWQGLGDLLDAMYWHFAEDGTCRGAFLLRELDANPNVTCTYEFDAANLIMIVVSERGLPHCPTARSVYYVELKGEDQIRFGVVQDDCIPRATTMRMVHQRVP
jgi:hypothetical protein